MLNVFLKCTSFVQCSSSDSLDYGFNDKSFVGNTISHHVYFVALSLISSPKMDLGVSYRSLPKWIPKAESVLSRRSWMVYNILLCDGFSYLLPISNKMESNLKFKTKAALLLQFSRLNLLMNELANFKSKERKFLGKKLFTSLTISIR